jgi:poly [ADP-ribose] polymerase
MPKPVQKQPILAETQFKTEKVVELNFFDLTGEKANTQGTSNKSYHAELQVSLQDARVQIFTMWGPTGGTQTKEWRHYDTKAEAEKEFASIIKGKIKKGYREIDVAQRAYGSDSAKQITKPVVLTGTDVVVTAAQSQLVEPTQRLIEQLFGSTAQFVATTLKCPLGQLTNEQINKGYACLDEATKIVNAHTSLTASQKREIERLTNDFYTEIPHNLGQGARGQMSHLLLDSIPKIVAKRGDVDTLSDAKSVGAVLNTTSGVDAQYAELNADLQWVDPKDAIFKFMSEYFLKSKVGHHGYASSKVKNLWRVERKDREKDYFLTNLTRIAKECGSHTFVREAKVLCDEVGKWVPEKRPDLDKELTDLYTKANTWLCWHGTRSANVVGITKKGLMVRPAGAVHTGSMFGDGKYFAWQSTKSLNYTDGGYWTGGRTRSNSRFMFLLDVALGHMHLAPRSHFYGGPPKGYHSVYGKANRSGVANDEMITYDFSQDQTQSRIRFLLEITD